MTSRLQQRRDTAANWTSNNPTLAAGEIGLETDTAKFKIGTGSTAWTSLSYAAAGTVTSITAGTGLSGGTISTSGTIAIDSTVATLTGTQTLTNKTLTNDAFIGALENANVVASAATGTINIDTITSTVWYYTSNASANFTLNIRGNSSTSLNTLLATNQAITVIFLNTNGSTAYYANSFTIDGTSVTPKWQTGTAPSAGNASAIDAYSYTILKTASATYTVFASQTKFA
jgi:Major tropism determinant N-terminal domain